MKSVAISRGNAAQGETREQVYVCVDHKNYCDGQHYTCIFLGCGICLLSSNRSPGGKVYRRDFF